MAATCRTNHIHDDSNLCIRWRFSPNPWHASPWLWRHYSCRRETT